MKKARDDLYGIRHSLYAKHRRRHKENPDLRQMCCMWGDSSRLVGQRFLRLRLGLIVAGILGTRDSRLAKLLPWSFNLADLVASTWRPWKQWRDETVSLDHLPGGDQGAGSHPLRGANEKISCGQSQFCQFVGV